MPESTQKERQDKASLGDRIRDAAEQVGTWLDRLLPGRQPVLVPVPVRRRRR